MVMVLVVCEKRMAKLFILQFCRFSIKPISPQFYAVHSHYQRICELVALCSESKQKNTDAPSKRPKLITRIDSIGGPVEQTRITVYDEDGACQEAAKSSDSSGVFDTPEQKLKDVTKRKLNQDKRKKERQLFKKDQNVISSKDFYLKKAEFATWLHEHAAKKLEDLSESKAKDLFKKFVNKWNRRKLDLKYYRGIDLYSSPLPKHKLQGGGAKPQRPISIALSSGPDRYDIWLSQPSLSPPAKPARDDKIMATVEQSDPGTAVLSGTPLSSFGQKSAPVLKRDCNLQTTPVKLMKRMRPVPPPRKRKSREAIPQEAVNTKITKTDHNDREDSDQISPKTINNNIQPEDSVESPGLVEINTNGNSSAFLDHRQLITVDDLIPAPGPDNADLDRNQPLMNDDSELSTEDEEEQPGKAVPLSDQSFAPEKGNTNSANDEHTSTHHTNNEHSLPISSPASSMEPIKTPLTGLTKWNSEVERTPEVFV